MEETDMDCQATSQFSVSQCDFPSITGPIWPSPVYVDASCPAKRLLPQQRRDLAIQVLAGTETVSELAREHEVSRKFLYQQVHTAQQALDSAFAPVLRSEEVLFYLPVTKLRTDSASLRFFRQRIASLWASLIRQRIASLRVVRAPSS